MRLLGWLVIALVVLSVGCDSRPKRVKVSGQVLIDGEPLNVGTVQFVPEGSRPAVGQLDDQGRFTLTTFDEGDGCVLGKHRVAVIANEMLSGNRMRYYAPIVYGNFETSDLTVDIDGPTDDLVIELSWHGGKPFTVDMDADGGDIDPATME
jgi:hypothetical protein